MSRVLFLHDTSLSTPRGAELTINELMSLGVAKDFEVDFNLLDDFQETKHKINSASIIIVNSTSRCSYELELINFLLDHDVRYIKVEYDYNFCIRRNILCTVDRKVKSCCNPNKFHIYRRLFAKSELNVFQSPKHYEAHYEFYGQALGKHLIMPPTVAVKHLNISSEKNDNVIPFFGNLNYLKGGNAYVDYAEAHPELQFHVYGTNRLRREMPSNILFFNPVDNTKVLDILGQTKTFICKPVWPEPSGRLAAEAFLSNCEMLTNDRVGTFSFDFYPNDKAKAISEMVKAPEHFWNEIKHLLEQSVADDSLSKKLGNVLVYKSYGGLGDIFFAVPAIYKLAQVSESLHFAVAPRLVEFFKSHLNGITVVNEEHVKTQETQYDAVYELGNYPAFRGYDLPHALKYPTHKKVKQHAIQHYIDTVSKLHIDIENQLDTYPYFERHLNKNNRYYVIHPGAGFLLKIWPTDKFALLIERLYELYPELDCKIIQGPNDPDIYKYFTSAMPHVAYVTGGMLEVGQIMSGALFHIGNDAGITHVAGSFNVPTVGIYGPTGPGSWGSFSEHNELIWGKKGVCDLKCNYDVIINCDHRICLTSITVDRVLEALYKVLQKAYPNEELKVIANPLLRYELNEHDCLLELNLNELLLEYHTPEVKLEIENLLLNNLTPDVPDEEFMEIFNVLNRQEIIFTIPRFE